MIVVPDHAPLPTVQPLPPPTSDLWQRIRLGFKMPDLDTKLAEDRTRWYASQPDYLARMTQRSSRYLFYIVEEIERRGMPTELALLPFVESAFVPEAFSSAKAAGLWQFIPSTGRNYDLEQNMWKDQRRDVVESTRAALDYLQKLYDMFGDWQLALASYNWGEGGIASDREEPPCRQTDALYRSENAERDEILRTETASDKEHRCQPGKVRRRTAADRQRALFHRGA